MVQATANPEGYISTLPGSSVVFHWPRSDYDQLLCVRMMDNVNCTWSGGFKVNKPKSFHINMRWILLFLPPSVSLAGTGVFGAPFWLRIVKPAKLLILSL